MKLSLRSPFLWISATILSGLLYTFAFHFFPQTFPIINLSITMDLEQALDKADELTEQYHFTPQDYQSAAMFHTDDTVKTFVELEAGGKDAFVAMMDEHLYMPYTWRVRHFKEHEKNETTIVFSPDGTPYGFIETISENIPGEQLSDSAAQQIAEHDATTHWNIDFSHYKLVEASQKLQPSKRLDHIFVYEHTDKKIGEGLYRLKIVISGNTMTELTHFVKVPEAFTRRYAEMRSANSTIALAASALMFLLYILGGCGFGLFYLSRRRWNIIKQPVLWAFFLALLSTLVSLNQLPFLWMHYNTAFSAHGFFMQLFLGFFMGLLGHTALLTLIITAAEGLTRRAFGNHPQLWSTLQPGVINSYAIFGRTVGGYLLVGFNCAFVIACYFLSTKYLGWWSPSETLFDPNILATYVPWFSPIAQSLNAGFMEECLFRAVPLAGAALLGEHFGKRNWWIGAALILQAVVFGAAHANYPVQPSYARLVELLIPSFIWGCTYLRFGLLPTIIAHVVYDIIWFSIPIFVAQTPHAFVYKNTIIFITLLPLLYILYARIKRGTWQELPHTALNSSWQSATVSEQAQKQKPIITTTESYTLTQTAQRLILALGAAGLLAWICSTPFTHDGVIITLTRNEAVEISNQFLKEKSFVAHTSVFAKASSDTPWKTLPIMFTHYKLIPQIALQHAFIWKEGKKELYHQLLGTYLHPAHWTIRYAQFDTDIMQRAEEYKIMLYNNHVWQYHHKLPETTTGAELTQDEARSLALATIKREFDLTVTDIPEMSATEAQLPQRKDWLFIFSDPTIYPLSIGQARISITITGDTVSDVARSIYVPEEWERAEQHKQNMFNIFMISFGLMFMFILLLALYIAFKQNKVFLFSKQLFWLLFSSIIAIFCIDICNSWPNLIGAFNTSLPFNNQLFQSIMILIISCFIKALCYTSVMTYIMSQKRSHQLPNNALTIMIGICSGLLMAGIFNLAQSFITDMPLWPSYEALSCSLPLVANITTAIMHYTQLTVLFSLFFMLIDTATQQWQKHYLFFTLFAALCGMTMVDLSSFDQLGIWIIIGTLCGLTLLAIYRYIIRYDYALIPLATASITILQIAQQGIFNAYPDANINACISACMVTAIAVLWYRYMNRS